MAKPTYASKESALKPKAASTGALVLLERSHKKGSEGPARHRLPEAFLFASVLAAVMIAGASTNASRAGAGPTPACAAQDLSALDVIEERSEVIGTSTQQIVEATRRFLQARKLCLSWQEDASIALYQNAINTALGFDLPIVNAKARPTSAAAIEAAPLSR
jgi:hypothetical protein